MIANFNWKSANTISGMVGASAGCVASPTRANMKKVLGFPTTPPMLSPKARLKPTKTQRRLITPRATMLCNIVETTFLKPTIPP
jgi:hypothetical protein